MNLPILSALSCLVKFLRVFTRQTVFGSFMDPICTKSPTERKSLKPLRCYLTEGILRSVFNSIIVHLFQSQQQRTGSKIKHYHFPSSAPEGATSPRGGKKDTKLNLIHLFAMTSDSASICRTPLPKLSISSS